MFLLFQRDGILSLLDEESHFPQSNDSSLVQKLNKYCKDSTRYAATMGNRVAFSIRHYAEQVRKRSFLFLFLALLMWFLLAGIRKFWYWSSKYTNYINCREILYMNSIWFLTWIIFYTCITCEFFLSFSVKINISTKNLFKRIAKELVTK